MTSALLIGAPHSGSGKSTITMGLLRALTRRGLRTQGFKCGPDYIDPQLHAIATGRPSINLDTFLWGEEETVATYHRYGSGADALVAEGVMGLHDGYDRDRGSSAEIARLLHLPILLVVTPGAMAYSAAPLLYGYRHFDPALTFAGVIFNKVGSPKHLRYLTEAAEDAGMPVLGTIPKSDRLVIPDRYLGLDTDDHTAIEGYAEVAADLIEEHLNLDRLLEETRREPIRPLREEKEPTGSLRIAVARDEACSFLYEENVRILRHFGEVIFFSPVHDQALPEGCDLVYLPGGYPELHLPKLAANSSMLRSLRDYIASDKPLLAECGGMMLLCREIIDERGTAFPLVGELDQSATMEGKRLTLGYRRLTIDGLPVQGHEFHYSHIVHPLPSATEQRNSWGEAVPTALWQRGRLFATYTHLALTDELIAHLLHP